MDRPKSFAENRFVGDKRVQIVHDLDAADDHAEQIDELIAAETYLAFGPDTLAEARNRGYRLCAACAAAAS